MYNCDTVGPERDNQEKYPEGSGLARGESVEIVGRRWAQRRTMEMQMGLARSVQIVRETKEYERRLALSTLTGEEGVSGAVGFDKVGNLYISRWDSKETGIDDERKRSLVNPRGYEYKILNRRRIRRDFINNLPKGIPVVELILSRVDSGVETAIRMQRRILERYLPGTGAQEVEQARRVVEKTDELAHRFITDKISKKDLESLARETGEFFEGIGLIDPRDPVKKWMQEMLLKVTLKDRLGRYNPLVSRVRARAAYLAATKRLVVGGMVIRKYATNEQVLLYERETTRWALQTANKQLDSLLGHVDFRRSDGKATGIQRSAIANILMNISEGHLAVPRVKPYLAPAMYVSINLNGCREFEKAQNRKILGDDIANELFSQAPTRKLVIDGRFSEAKERISLSRKVITKTLRDYEDIEKA